MRLLGEPHEHEDGMVTQWFAPDEGGPPYGQVILRSQRRPTAEQRTNLEAAVRYMRARYGTHSGFSAWSGLLASGGDGDPGAADRRPERDEEA